ncbi:MAG: diacylglycerol kinase family protein [Planctomycetaceae bacterium]|jgi:diacylglycerol kinase|nr:diacylglycerol kinase family protein [Planctomycetaceae bacterium]
MKKPRTNKRINKQTKKLTGELTGELSKKPPYHFSHGKRTWSRKFTDAFLGLRQSVHQQSSYHVHFTAAIAVLGMAWLLGNFDTVRWSLLVLCIAMVIAGEMFNTAIETLARAITQTYNPVIGRALDIASGAVLVLSFGAAVVGLILFFEAIWKKFGSLL